MAATHRSGRGVREGIRDLRERELPGDQPLHAERRHQRERAPERGATAERAAERDLTKVYVEEIDGELAAFRIHADDLCLAAALAAWRRRLAWRQLRYSSGTGSCASLVAAATFGGAARLATVVAPGGAQQVDWRDDQIYLTGWAEIVFDGAWRRSHSSR